MARALPEQWREEASHYLRSWVFDEVDRLMAAFLPWDRPGRPAVVTSEPDRGPDEINDTASTGAAWLALERARAEQGPQILTSALAAVYQHYVGLARTLAGQMGAGHDPDEAMRAAEVGLAQAVLGWRRSDGQGFELVASISIAAQLDHLGSDYS